MRQLPLADWIVSAIGGSERQSKHWVLMGRYKAKLNGPWKVQTLDWMILYKVDIYLAKGYTPYTIVAPDSIIHNSVSMIRNGNPWSAEWVIQASRFRADSIFVRFPWPKCYDFICWITWKDGGHAIRCVNWRSGVNLWYFHLRVRAVTMLKLWNGSGRKQRTKTAAHADTFVNSCSLHFSGGGGEITLGIKGISQDQECLE